jgi:mannose-6-phosphate isomerase-like protein (cupin superfamily)
MKNRRDFLKTSAFTLGVASLFSQKSFASSLDGTSLVKQPEECETYFVRENTPITFHLSKSRDNISNVSLLSEELMPGSAIPVHKHLSEDEFFFFISGTGTGTLGDQTFTFKPGTSVFIPKNTWHSFQNTGKEKAFCTFSYSPAGFEDFFKEIGTLKGREFKAKSKEELDRIAKKYGMVFK